MQRVVWINGAFVPPEEARVPIFDRGLLFADAVYEGLGVLDGRIVDEGYHLARLARSLAALSIPMPMPQEALIEGLQELIARNGMAEGFLYLHITRGVQERDYVYADGLVPTVFAFTQPGDGVADEPVKMIRFASTPDLRWARRDIKTSNLLGQVMAKVAAHEAGADEALMLDDAGFVTEGGSMSFFIVRDGAIFARPLARDLLPGVTRRSVLEVAAAMGLELRDDRYVLADVLAADEAFATGASSYVQGVSHVDGQVIGDGGPGPVTVRLRDAYLRAVRERMGAGGGDGI